jgi:hypothetical protein
MPLRYVPLTDPQHAADALEYPVPDSTRGAPPATYPYRRVTFLAASGEHEAATDIGRDLIERFPTRDGLPHGALTDSVLRVLTGRMQADGNSDGQLSYDELYQGVRRFMDERGYPHTPRLLPDGGGDREELVERPLFELARVPATEWAPVPEEPLRVRLASDMETLVPALRGIGGFEFTERAPDIVIVRDADDIVLEEPDGEPIDRLASASGEDLVQRLQREAWVRRVLRTPAAPGSFNVKVDLSTPEPGTLVVEGEPIAFTVATDKPAYVVMLGIDPAARVRVLYPSDPDAIPAPVRPGVPLSVPNSDPSSVMRVTSPFGVEYIVVAAIESRPVGLMALAGREVGPDAPLRQDLERILADAERQGAKTSLRFKTAGAVPSP